MCRPSYGGSNSPFPTIISNVINIYTITVSSKIAISEACIATIKIDFTSMHNRSMFGTQSRESGRRWFRRLNYNWLCISISRRLTIIRRTSFFITWWLGRLVRVNTRTFFIIIVIFVWILDINRWFCTIPSTTIIIVISSHICS